MKIVVLDGRVLNPGDLDWSPLAAFGALAVHDRTPRAETLDRAKDAEILLTNKVALDRELIEALPGLRYIGVTATGYNVVDIAAANARGIVVTNVPAYGTASVAQSCFALLLELANSVGRHDRAVHEGRWSRGPDFSFWEKPLVELSGLTMGLIGFGAIGQAVARIALGFGMKVLAATRSPSEAQGIEFCGLDDLFRRADVLSLHCPLTDDTRHIVNAGRLALMKPGAFLINTSRGGLVDEPALAAALNEGRLAGAGLDVLSVEPPDAGNPLLSARNCVITPHIAWASEAARRRLLHAAIGNVKAFVEGAPINVVGTVL